MKNNLSFKLVVISLFLYCGNNSLEAASGKKYALASPDGKLKVEISTGDKLSYQVIHENDTILSHSNIGLVLADGTTIENNSQVTGIKRKKVRDNVESPFYRFKKFIVTCNELNLKLKGDFGVTFRAYDEGVAYRFYTTQKTEVTIKEEVAEFNFNQDYTAYLPYTTNDKKPMAMAFPKYIRCYPTIKGTAESSFPTRYSGLR